MKIKTILYLFILLNLLTLFSCSEESELSLVNKQITGLIKIVEQHQYNKLNQYIAKDFQTTSNLNKSQFLIFTRHHIKRNKNISIILLDKEVINNVDGFDVTFRALLLGSNKLLPERKEIYKISSRWIKEDGGWMISRLRWEKN